MGWESREGESFSEGGIGCDPLTNEEETETDTGAVVVLGKTAWFFVPSICLHSHHD